MLEIKVKTSESFNEETNEFKIEEITIELEHSLVTLSKWESEFEKPFLGPQEKSTEEVMSYVRTMIVTPDVPSNILELLSQENMEQINKYIDAKMTATWFNEPKTTQRTSEQITSELIYYWIVSYQIPWEVENWHLNRLFTLIKVFNAKNTKQKKMTRGEMVAQRRAMNQKRMEQYGTSG